MPKKGKAKAAPAPAAAAPAPAASSKAQEEEERALLEKQWQEKAAANKKKAEQAQASQIRQNQKNQEWERERQKEQMQQAREEKKWTKELEKIKAKAKSEGVLESEDWGDGVWWVKLGDVYKEVKGEFYCHLCEKHLTGGSLEAHLNSELHKKRLAWGQPEVAGAAAGAPSVTTGSASASSARPRVCPPANGPAAWPAYKMEEWMERLPDGGLRCIPCQKVVDDLHLAKEDHINRVTRWEEEQKARKYGRPVPPAPALPYLAWVPWDESDPASERNLKCLLCNKWVQDTTSHSGTPKEPAGAKDHLKYLRNYGPGNHWYEENVVKIRRKWHPDARPSAPSVSLRHAEVVEA